MKKSFLPAILSRDFINDAGYFTRNVTIKPVIFTDTNETSGEVKDYPSFAVSVTKLSWKEDNRSISQKAYIDKDGKPASRPDSNTLYLPPEVLQSLKDDLQDIDFSKDLFAV